MRIANTLLTITQTSIFTNTVRLHDSDQGVEIVVTWTNIDSILIEDPANDPSSRELTVKRISTTGLWDIDEVREAILSVRPA